MGKHRKPKRPTDELDYEVGYRKPPKAHAFKSNNNANPAGRPKKREEMTLPELARELLNKRMSPRPNGEVLTIREGLLNAQAAKGMQGNTKATAFLLEIADRRDDSGDEAEVQDADDFKIIVGYLKELQARK